MTDLLVAGISFWTRTLPNLAARMNLGRQRYAPEL
jgi:hypothetical protein